MKNYIILFCLALFFGCDKIPSGVSDVHESSYEVTGMDAPADFVFDNADSSFTVTLKLNSSSDIEQVWIDVYSPDGTKMNEKPFQLADNGNKALGDTAKGDNVFSNRYPFSQSYVNGIYKIEYFVQSTDGLTNKVAEHTFKYDNKQTDYPPVLSDLVMPDTVNAGEPFNFSVRVTDKNGLTDVKKVYFKFIRLEDGSASPNVDMWNDGEPLHGDEIKGDDIYSFSNYFTLETKGKTRQFVFQAVDRSDSLSNIITHNIYVK
ncbi:MAG TPA: hypothetical protein VHO43_16980 [Ignavibacteriales bacterium]|nr:hypothetical protein [Ignavibacteriales bacterium]